MFIRTKLNILKYFISTIEDRYIIIEIMNDISLFLRIRNYRSLHRYLLRLTLTEVVDIYIKLL